MPRAPPAQALKTKALAITHARMSSSRSGVSFQASGVSPTRCEIKNDASISLDTWRLIPET
jgi:hypothetical protein